MPIEQLFAEADIVTLHAPLMESTHHMINADLIAKAKKGLMLINCARGGLVDTAALIEGLRSGQIGSYGMDVYEEEGSIFFRDFTCKDAKDRMATFTLEWAALRSFPNVLITPHSAFLTTGALTDIVN